MEVNLHFETLKTETTKPQHKMTRETVLSCEL